MKKILLKLINYQNTIAILQLNTKNFNQFESIINAQLSA